MAIKKYKTLTAADQFKGLSKTFSSQLNAYGHVEGGTQDLTWYLVDRNTSLWNTDDMKNLFMSFGLARENDSDQDELDRAFGFTDWYKGKQILVATIPQSGCASYIDGSTVVLRVPTGTSSGDYVEFFGSTFGGERDGGSGRDICMQYADSVYGGAYCYLFPNTQGNHSIDEDTYGEHPYTGTIDGNLHANQTMTTWTGANTDNKTFYPHLRATQWTRNPDDGRDVPYGIALLEKGIFVIFDMTGGRDDFLGAFMTGGTGGAGIWTADTATFDAITVTGTAAPNLNSNNMRAIRFTGSSGIDSAKLIYRTVTEDYKLVYFCHAGQNEFNSTSNHTYDHRKAFFRPEEAADLYITEIALYDDHNEVLAYAKLSKPVAKSQLETLTFKVELNIGSS